MIHPLITTKGRATWNGFWYRKNGATAHEVLPYAHPTQSRMLTGRACNVMSFYQVYRRPESYDVRDIRTDTLDALIAWQLLFDATCDRTSKPAQWYVSG